jgi:mono/diheme cytochrome c family protein
MKMNFIIGMIGIAFFLISCGGSGKLKTDNTRDTFKQYCALCHGMDGTLQLNGAKDFSKSILTLDERINIITNGKNTMTPYKGILSPEQIQELAEYTMKFSN